MSDKPLKRSLGAFLKMLHRSARNHKNGLRHYTTMTSFVRMQDSGQVYFSLLPNSNDGGEYKSNRHYMMCFNFGKEENIALWSLYGVPHADSICLTFPHRDIMEWFDSAKEGGLSFYGLEDKRRSVLLNDACPNPTFHVRPKFQLFHADNFRYSAVGAGFIRLSPQKGV